MKGRAAMNDEKHNSNAVLIYLLLLIMFVISNMIKEVTILDVIYLIALVCSVLKYFMVVRENRK